jgi:hypothetical protein
MEKILVGEQRFLHFIASSKGNDVLFPEIVHRDATELPRWVADDQPYVGVASDELLSAAGNIPGTMPEGWRDLPNVFWKPDAWVPLKVRRFGTFWRVERRRVQEEILLCDGLIVCSRAPEGAMRIAECCESLQFNPYGKLRWSYIDTALLCRE